jgi:hypothetical protein
MNRTIRCTHCRCLVLPNPRVKTQRFCSNKACQQARKAQWQRTKMATDPDCEQKARCIGNESERKNALFASRDEYVCKLLQVASLGSASCLRRACVSKPSFSFHDTPLRPFRGGLSDGNRRFQNARENQCPAQRAGHAIEESFVKGACLSRDWRQSRWAFPAGRGWGRLRVLPKACYGGRIGV